MVKSKYSASQRQRLGEIDSIISKVEANIESVVEATKSELWNAYRSYPHGSNPDFDQRLSDLLDDYEPSITESIIGEMVYGEANPHYGEVIDYLEDNSRVIMGTNADDFYLQWASFKNASDERKRIIAGQMVMRFK